jgi:hypothetical protein
MKRTVHFWTFLLAMFAVAASPVCSANLTQGDLLFELDQVYTGIGTPQGTPPWLSATFLNLGSNSVQLTMNYAGSAPGSAEYVSSWFFNFNPSFEVLGLNIQPVSGVSANPIIKAADGVKAGGDLFFDVQFLFPANSFSGGNSSVYLISSTVANESIDALSFDFLSTNSLGLTNYYSSANILGITGGLNGWIAAATSQKPGPGPGPTPIAEPATMILLGCGLGGLTVFGRRKFFI